MSENTTTDGSILTSLWDGFVAGIEEAHRALVIATQEALEATLAFGRVLGADVHLWTEAGGKPGAFWERVEALTARDKTTLRQYMNAAHEYDALPETLTERDALPVQGLLPLANIPKRSKAAAVKRAAKAATQRERVRIMRDAQVKPEPSDAARERAKKKADANASAVAEAFKRDGFAERVHSLMPDAVAVAEYVIVVGKLNANHSEEALRSAVRLAFAEYVPEAEDYVILDSGDTVTV